MMPWLSGLGVVDDSCAGDGVRRRQWMYQELCEMRKRVTMGISINQLMLASAKRQRFKLVGGGSRSLSI